MENPDDQRVQELGDFLEELVRSLHVYGLPSHRLEEAMNDMARILDVEAQFLITPTSVIMSTGTRTRLLRIDQGETDLERLTEIDRIMKEVKTGERSAIDATVDIRATASRPDRYGPWLTLFSFSVASATAALFFKGGWRESVGAAVVGGLIGILVVMAPLSRRFARLLPATAAFVAVVVSHLLAMAMPPMFTVLTTLAGLIVLIPGLTLTVAMNELAHYHVVSGTARLTGAAITFLQLGFGAAVGWKVSPYLGELTLVTDPTPVATWIQAVNLPVITASFVVLFKAHPRDYPGILVGAVVAYSASSWGSYEFGPEVGMAFGAWALGCTSTLLARWLDRPSAVPLIPGLLLLVPGSLGLRSLQAFVSRDVPLGVETAFTMTLFAMALVTGLFLANLTLRPRPL